MIIVFELVAVGAAAIAAASIWHKIQLQRRIRAVDARLAKMQRELEALQIQESRRVMMALKGNPKAEWPGIEPNDSGTVDIGGDIVRLVGKPRATPVQ
jgi:hypothetical protein